MDDGGARSDAPRAVEARTGQENRTWRSSLESHLLFSFACTAYLLLFVFMLQHPSLGIWLERAPLQ